LTKLGGFNFKKLRLVPQEYYDSLKRGKIKQNDVLVVKDGATTGKVSFVDNDFPFQEAAVNEHVFILRGKKDLVYPKFLFYHIFSPFGQLQVMANFRGAAIGGINTQFVKNYYINLPSLETQEKIVKILEKAEKLKEWRAEADELADDYLESIFYDMFGDPINNQKGYEKIKLEKLSKIRRGGSPRPIKNYLGGNVPWIKIGDGTKGDEIYIEDTKEKITEDGLSKTVLLKKGSLIFANCGVSLGFARILKIEGCIHDGWLALEDIDPKLNKIYLLKLINSISDYFRKSAPDGTQPNLNTKIMKNFEIPVPPITLQNQFAQIVQKTETLKTHQSKSKQEIDNLFNTLMQKAFKGELVC
ncbi:MAG: restriction endonuclease subunit S, partial [Methanobacteriaceae archaeon]|nr:restriction endonuclease subunit S [Methanobacteriaceae archaeon]